MKNLRVKCNDFNLWEIVKDMPESILKNIKIIGFIHEDLVIETVKDSPLLEAQIKEYLANVGVN